MEHVSGARLFDVSIKELYKKRIDFKHPRDLDLSAGKPSEGKCRGQASAQPPLGHMQNLLWWMRKHI